MLFWGCAAVFMRRSALALSAENSVALCHVVLSVINLAGLFWLGTCHIPKADLPRFLLAGVAGGLLMPAGVAAAQFGPPVMRRIAPIGKTPLSEVRPPVMEGP